MPAFMARRVLVATALLAGAVLSQIMPISGFLHEVAEHDALEMSHCACLVCHASAHAPMELGGARLSLPVDDRIAFSWLSEAQVAPTPKFRASVPGRSPPSV